MTSGWTGGQYSVFRLVFGVSLIVHFDRLLPWRGVSDGAAGPLSSLSALTDSPYAVTALLALALAASAALAIGFHDRLAAAVVGVLAGTLGRDPGLLYLGFILLAHACIASAPFGSWRERGSPDAGAGWRLPRAVFAIAWILLALDYAHGGYTKLTSPSWIDGTAIAHALASPPARPGWLRDTLLAAPAGSLRLATWSGLTFDLVVAPLALFSWARPWLWLGMLGVQIARMTLVDPGGPSLGLAMLHLLAFDPAWLRPRPGGPETIFYDGHCGVCHALVRWVISEDRAGVFRFAPLGGPAHLAALDEAERRATTDSVVVRDTSGRLLTRSAAVLHVAGRLGGLWRLLAALARAIPEPLRDTAYTHFARVRRKLFRTPEDTCPVLPKDLRARFDP